jgi:hypothetical protein
MLTIATIVGNSYFVPWGFVQSLLKLPPKYLYKSSQGAFVHLNRNYIWEEMKAENKETKADLLFIDCDIMFEPMDVSQIESDLEKYDIVTGLYVIKGWEYKPMIYRKEGEEYVHTDIKDGIFEVDGCGSGFLAISHRVINHPALAVEPFNLIQCSNGMYSEDLSFCLRAQQAGFKIHCDSSIKLGHIKTQVLNVGDKEPDIY